MFRRNKENKAKLEHKLYLARETPEPVFDLSDCAVRNVPQGIYSLCRVFLKEILRLECNSLTSLNGGGELKDLQLLKVLDLHDNAFVQIPDEICLLRNLKELYLNNNQLKNLPNSLCLLSNLQVLNVSHNCLKALPEHLGNLSNLTLLSICENRHLKNLPHSICKAKRLRSIELDADNFSYPPKPICVAGTEAIQRYICNDVGINYVPPEEVEDINTPQSTMEGDDDSVDHFEKQKLQEFLEIEKANEMLQKQEFELASAQKLNREKLLADISQQQLIFDQEVLKIQQEKEMERFQLIEQLQEAEQNADVAIKQLLALNTEPWLELLEQEKREEERLIAAANKYNETLRKSDILADMEIMLQQESKKFQELHENRLETSKSILDQELELDVHLSQVLQDQDYHKAALVSKLLEDSDLQKAAVAKLLERGDARSWGLVQQVRLVELQLAALTAIEMDRRKLQLDDHLNDLAEKRINLSFLLMDLLEQQKERQRQLLYTLHTLEAHSDHSSEDFWLRQYQRLLDKLPSGLSEAQKNIDPILAQALLSNGVINCLPFLAKFMQCQCDLDTISDNMLLEAGIINRVDRLHVLDAFHMYKKEQMMKAHYSPTAPSHVEIGEASAPLPEHITNISTSECVICMDMECQVIFVPCGHLCCCLNCSGGVSECPMCRAEIERKIRVIQS